MQTIENREPMTKTNQVGMKIQSRAGPHTANARQTRESRRIKTDEFHASSRQRGRISELDIGMIEMFEKSKKKMWSMYVKIY